MLNLETLNPGESRRQQLVTNARKLLTVMRDAEIALIRLQGREIETLDLKASLRISSKYMRSLVRERERRITRAAWPHDTVFVGTNLCPAELRPKHGIEAGTKVKILEEQFGSIVLQPITEDYIDRVMGCLADGEDLLANWEKEHRAEGKHDR